MGLRAMKVVFRADIPDPTKKYVLMVIASYARDDSGTWDAWPSVARLCQDTNLTRRTIQTSLRKSRRDGLICPVQPAGRHHAVTYRLNEARLRAARYPPGRRRRREGLIVLGRGRRGVPSVPFEATKVVMRARIPRPIMKHVLMVMATYLSNDSVEWFVWPSTASLQRDTGLSERTIRRQLREAERAGLIAQERPAGRWRGVTYRIDADQLRAMATPAQTGTPVRVSDSFVAETAES